MGKLVGIVSDIDTVRDTVAEALGSLDSKERKYVRAIVLLHDEDGIIWSWASRMNATERAGFLHLADCQMSKTVFE
jgi:hypothetical protein